MKKVNEKSIENRHHYCSGDYVIDTKLNKEQCEIIREALENAHDKKMISGYEYTVVNDNAKNIYNSCCFKEEIHGLMTFKSIDENLVDNDLFFNNSLQFGANAIGFYGDRAYDVYVELKDLVINKFGLRPKLYQVV